MASAAILGGVTWHTSNVSVIDHTMSGGPDNLLFGLLTYTGDTANTDDTNIGNTVDAGDAGNTGGMSIIIQVAQAMKVIHVIQVLFACLILFTSVSARKRL